MRVGPFHLSYCTNIHAGERWPDVRASLGRVLPRIREVLDVTAPLAIGLRLSAAAAGELAHAAALDEFRAFLARGNYYVPTINGFPYGAFHGVRVKERVYLPDWRDPSRVAYSNQLAAILAALLPADLPCGSVSTVPGAFKPHVTSEADVDAIAGGIRAHADFLRRLERDTGRRIRLALEPEPSCLIETVDETCDFFARHLADDTSRRYVGACVDTCHMAVEFEEPSHVNTRLAAAGVDIVKVQVSSALSVPASASQPLAPFAEDTYLHQVVDRADGRLTRFVDLPDALGCPSPENAERRVHFHVPLFLSDLGGLETTQAFVRAYLAALAAEPVCDQLEVETYTWDVLPAEHRAGDVAESIARELAWVRNELRRAGDRPA